MNDLYQMMDLFALPSNFEGNPISSIEAQASGLKVFLADTITPESDITGNVTYLPLDTKMWSDAFVSIEPYERMDMYQKIVCHGRDSATQIKVLESAYISGLEILGREETEGGGTAV